MEWTDGYKICYNAAAKGRFGVGLNVSESYKNRIMDFIPVNEKLAILKIKARFPNIILINVHAPKEDKEIVEKERFSQL